MRIHLSRLALLCVALVSSAATAQTYPTHPVKILVTTAGAPDIISRVVAEKLTESLGQPFLVELRGGANGNIAGEATARSAPDGHSLLLCPDSLMVSNPHVYARMGFDPQKDLAPVSLIASSELFLAANPNQPFRTFPEFIEYAKKAKPPLAYGSNGPGGQHHLTMEMLKARTGIDLLHIPYKTASAAATAAIAGEVAVLFSGGAAGPLIRAGRLRPLAVAGNKRVAAFPDLPTLGEFYPGLSNTVWLGLCGPRGMSEPVLARLRGAVGRALASADVKEKFNRAGGLEPLITTPEEFAAMIRTDFDKYGKLVRELGIRVDQ